MSDRVQRNDQHGNRGGSPADPGGPDRASTASGNSRSPTFPINKVPPGAVWHWLGSGLRDMQACHYLSLVYGACFVGLGFGVEHAHSANGTFALALVVGFVFVGPFTAMGVYELSRQVQHGESIDLLVSLFCWVRNRQSIGKYAAVLAVVLMLWIWTFYYLLDDVAAATSAADDLPTWDGAIAQINGVMAFAWVLLAIIVYIASVISVPMLLDRPVGPLTAIRTSMASCIRNPLTMMLWAILILAIIGPSLYFGYWPLLVTGPLIGHATWHAYRESGHLSR